MYCLHAAHERYRHTFSKVSFNLSCYKNRLEIENICPRQELIVKKINNNKVIRVGDLNLGTVGNQKHTHFFCLALELLDIMQFIIVLIMRTPRKKRKPSYRNVQQLF